MKAATRAGFSKNGPRARAAAAAAPCMRPSTSNPINAAGNVPTGVSTLTAAGLGIVDVSTRDPDLEDVFLSLVAADEAA